MFASAGEVWYPSPMRTEVIWFGDRVVALNKPAGLSLATPRSEPGAAVARLLDSMNPRERRELGLEPETALLVHRLDVGTTGIVLLARDPEAHAVLAQAFSEKRAGRTYLALAWDRPRPKEGRFEWPLGPDRKDRRKMRVDEGGKSAATAYRVLGAGPHASLVELRPETGRTHQIRVHLAHSGRPVVGDDLYGGPRHRGVSDPLLRSALSPDHPFLHAWRLHLPQNRICAEIILVAPPPKDFLRALRVLGLALLLRGPGGG